MPGLFCTERMLRRSSSSTAETGWVFSTRFFKIDQGVERQAGGVFQAIFVANLCSEFGVGAGFPTQFAQTLEQRAVTGAESGDALGVFGVDTRAVGQHQANAGERVI
nr:hypothetical protein [Tanacetum cinerariifolium]